MVEETSILNKFYDYLEQNDKTWLEAGLVKNAPLEAVEAYNEWKKEELERIKNKIT